MGNKREITRRYNKLIEEVKTHPYYTSINLENKVNCYVCSCGHVTKTRVVDAGVTPMFFICEKCKSRASSSFFKDIAPNQSPTIEWYRPTLKQVLKMKHDAMVERVLSGGLDFRIVQK